MIHFNTRSLPKNLHKIEELLNRLKFKPGILAISESKLNNNNLNQALLNNYHNMLCTNSLSSSGGVAIFIADNLKFNKLDEFSIANDNAETLFVEIDTPGKSKDLGIGTIYKHPGANIHTFQEELCSTLGQLADKREYIICGDINIDLPQYQLKAPITNYVNSIYLEGCYILPL